VALLLREKGLEAYVMQGGLKAWEKAGYPTEQVPADDLVLLPRFN